LMNVRARLVGCRELFQTVFQRLEDLSRLCCARLGFVGAFIEDKNSGAILIQQPIRRQMQTRTIDSKLTAAILSSDAAQRPAPRGTLACPGVP